MARRTVCLSSGGLDSTTALARCVERGDAITSLTFDYGQRHRREVEAARHIARHYDIADHRIISLDLGQVGGSSLTADLPVPEDRPPEEIVAGIPSTYVPFRNSIFLAFATAVAEVVGAESIVLGINHLDYSGYPDCRPEYMEAFQQVIRLGSRAGVEGQAPRLEAPLVHLDKAGIVREAVRLRVPLELTWSCYHGRALACGRCDSCLLRLKGFAEAAATDPLPYEPLPARAVGRRQ